jgi:predicted DCC family thiol-disulfide oxidoreductase YuxK
VLFDGYCGLCDGLVRWLVAHDRHRRLRYGPLQGRAAAEIRDRHPELPGVEETFVLVEAPGKAAERIRVRSDAALALLTRLGGLWRLVAALRLVPAPLRDLIYAWVARRRRRWFGTLDRCRTPSAAERPLFLE